MRTLLQRWLSSRVIVRPADFKDFRATWEVDQWWGLLFRAKVNRNLFERGSLACRITPDPEFTPSWMRAEVPAILRRQAA